MQNNHEIAKEGFGNSRKNLPISKAYLGVTIERKIKTFGKQDISLVDSAIFHSTVLKRQCFREWDLTKHNILTFSTNQI